MGKFIDLTEQKFGKLTVIKRVENYRSENGSVATQWLCKCDCGNEIIVASKNLRKGNTQSCGCFRKMRNIKDLTGKKFGKLTVLHFAYIKNQKSYWLCQCKCGNQKIINGAVLSFGLVYSCGCAKKEATATHKKSDTKIYRVFISMKSRCYNPKSKAYKYYGARGIKICDEWLNNFMNFYNWAINNGYKEGLSIDRIDVNGNYSPDNCRWTTNKKQSRNTRRNVFITFNNETHCISEWAEIVGISKEVLKWRLKKWGTEKALTTPKLH